MGRLDFPYSRICVLLLVLLFTGGCYGNIASSPFPSQTPSQSSITTSTLSPSETAMANASQTPRPKDTISSYRCKWPPILISGEKTTDFYWLPNGNELVFKQEGSSEWFVYALEDGIINKYDPSIVYTRTPEPVDISDYSDLFISPDRESIVYTRSIEGGYRIFASPKYQGKDRFIGEIKGKIDQAIWIQNGDKLIISIDWQSPLGAREAAVYLIDLVNVSLKVIIPSTLDLPNISIFGITPDENQILFTSYSGDIQLRLWDLSDGSLHNTNIYPPITLKWLPDKITFVAVGVKDDTLRQFLYQYNIQKDVMENLLPNELRIKQYRKDVIQISPTLKWIAFIDEDDLIKIIDCNGLAQ